MKSLVLGLVLGFQTLTVYAQVAPVKEDVPTLRIPCTELKPELGERSCAEVKKDATSIVRKGISHVIANYYDGKLLNFHEPLGKEEVARGFCKQQDLPKEGTVCNVADPKNPEGDQNWKGEKCGDKFAKTAAPVPGTAGYCQITPDGGLDLASCAKERDWFERGGQIQAWAHYLEEVSAEIDKGELSLVNYAPPGEEPKRPCAGFARYINHILGVHDENDSIRVAERIIRRDFPEAELSTELSAACLKEGRDASLMKVSKTAIFDQRNPASAEKQVEVKSVEFEKDAFENKNGILKQNKTLSQAACQLAFARRQVETLFYKLASCEVMQRANRNYYQNFRSMDLVMAPLTTQVISPCIAYARGLNDQDNLLPNFYKCYKGEVGGKTGVKKFFADFMKGRGLATSQAIPHEKLGEDADLQACGSGAK